MGIDVKTDIQFLIDIAATNNVDELAITKSDQKILETFSGKNTAATGNKSVLFIHENKL